MSADYNHHHLDDLIHSRIRLAIMSVLIAVGEVEFTFLREKVETTDGNLSIHAKKLEDAGYLTVTKKFVKKKPVTSYRLTAKGREAFQAYVEQLGKMLGSAASDHE